MAAPEKLTFGSYEVLRNADGTPCILGQGSFGVTYKARHVLLGRVNALKVIREDLLNRGSKEDQDETKRFLGEARAVGKLQHPGIAVVHDCALDAGVFYYAMEYCDGGSLQDWCVKHGAMPWSEVRPMALQIASALDYAHGSGFLHRDLKPSNIMLTGEGGLRQAKLIDFGLAKKFAIDAEASTTTIRDDKENFRGNYATASPEQILEKPLDQRSDLFSLGVTLWWLLLGKNPFGGMKHGPMIADRVGPSSYGLSLPGDLESEARGLLEGLLEKDVERRIATAFEVVERLDSAFVRAGPTDASAASVVADSAGSVTGPGRVAVPLPGPPDLEDAYVVGTALATANQAKLYSGENLATRQAVVVIIPDAALDPAARSGLRIAASRRLDFGAYAFLDWRFSGGDDVFVISKPEGCSLMAILRKFGSARFIDALPFLSHLARCFDASEAWITFGIQVEPGEILVGTRDGSTDINRIHSWSDLDPLATRCLPLFTSAGDHGASSEATLSTSAHEFPPMAQFAALVYRVLSGSAVKYASFFTTSGYVMASGLSEDGNALLASTISDPATQPSACRFIRSLAGLESLPITGILPLVAPPSTHDIEVGKLDPTPSTGSTAGAGTRVRPLETARPAASGKAAADTARIAEIEGQLAMAKLAAEKEFLKDTAKAQRQQEEANQRANQEGARQQAAAKQVAAEQARRQVEAVHPATVHVAPSSMPEPVLFSAPVVSRNRSKVLAIAAVLCVLSVSAATIAFFVIKGHAKTRLAREVRKHQTEVDNRQPEGKNRPADDIGPVSNTRPNSNAGPGDSAGSNRKSASNSTSAHPANTGPDTSAESSSTVKVPNDAKTLADAIKRCQEGGTIEIAGGTYSEAILLTKSVSLVATSSAVFEDRGLGSNLIVASGSIQVTLRNIQMKNTEEEIKASPQDSPALVLIKNGASVRFDGCVIEHSTGDGVSLADKSSASFSNCPVRNNHGFGIHVSGASKVESTLGEIRGNGRSGIALTNTGSTVKLDGTVIEGNTENGVVVGNGAELHCSGVTIHGNRLEQKQKEGLLVEGGGSRARLEASCVISANCVSGIGVIDAGRLELDDCTVADNSKNGLYVKSGGQVEINSCLFTSNGQLGVALMDSPSKISISKSQFKTHSELGVAIEQGNGIVSGCSFTNNTAAIYFGEGASGSASGNSMQPGPLEKVLIQENTTKVSFENNTIGAAP